MYNTMHIVTFMYNQNTQVTSPVSQDYNVTNIPLFFDSPSTCSGDVSMSMGIAGKIR